jgi:LysR family transcriptional regulator, regulator for bpeEF and oprC
MDQVAALRAFVRVVETGSFTRASNVLTMPKASLTKLVQGLEAHVQTKLLHRTTRRVTVTTDGAAYYERVVRLLADLDELDASMTLSHASPKGRLRIDVSASLALLVIIPAFPAFHARYPDIQLEIGVTDRPVDLIGENVDCVVRGGELADQSLIARRIAELHFITCAAPEYLARHGEPAHPTDLMTTHHVVGYFSPGTGRAHPFTFARDGEHHEVVGRSVVSLNDGNAYTAAALAGLGIIQAPRLMVQRHVDSGALVPVLTSWSAGTMPLHVVYPPNRHLSNKVRVLVDWLAEVFARSR